MNSELDFEGDPMAGTEVLRLDNVRSRSPREDCPEAYSIRSEPAAIGGLIVYGLYARGWVANPQLRHLIRELLSRLGVDV